MDASQESFVTPTQRDLADERDRRADARDRVADERDQAANERERLVNEREQRADARDKLADRREDRLCAQEQRLENQRRTLRLASDELTSADQDSIHMTIGHTAYATASPTPLPTSVHRAMTFINDNAKQTITVTDIATAAGIGTRALQNAFRRYHDTTPLEYLRRVRLEHVHRELQAGDPTTGATVGAIAARWQFTHLSHFSGYYRDTYGQSPSWTLRT